MSEFIGIIFPTEAKANEGSRMLKDLHAEGSIALSGMVVVAKNATGSLSVKKSMDKRHLGTAAGALIGGLAGLPGGPIGVLFGAAGGALLAGQPMRSISETLRIFSTKSRESYLWGTQRLLPRLLNKHAATLIRTFRPSAERSFASR